MLRNSGSHHGFLESPLMLAALMWLCALSLVLILTLPFLSVERSAGIVIGLFVLLLAACPYLCSHLFNGARPSGEEMSGSEMR